MAVETYVVIDVCWASYRSASIFNQDEMQPMLKGKDDAWITYLLVCSVYVPQCLQSALIIQ